MAKTVASSELELSDPRHEEILQFLNASLMQHTKGFVFHLFRCALDKIRLGKLQCLRHKHPLIGATSGV